MKLYRVTYQVVVRGFWSNNIKEVSEIVEANSLKEAYKNAQEEVDKSWSYVAVSNVEPVKEES